MRHGTQDRRRQRDVEVILDTLNLDRRNLHTLQRRNPSARAPYHGYQHLLTVARNAFHCGVAEGLGPWELRTLVLAALWHDYDHTMGAGDDAINIERAVEGFLAHADRDERTDIEAVVAAIRATEHPAGVATTTVERVLRDADMLQTLEVDGKRFLAGLAEETGLPLTEETDTDFYRTAEFSTHWAQQLVADHLDGRDATLRFK